MIGAARHRSDGTILVLTLVVVAILSVIAASQLMLVRAEVGAAAAARRGHQARAAAMSGIYRAMAVLAAGPHDIEARYDAPDLFQAQRIDGQSDAGGTGGWYFTVYADNPADPENLRYGIEDDSGKISLNTATRETLLKLGLTDEQADSLLDFLDADADARANGAEQEYYDALPRPYQINNGLLTTVEQLLLVKGFTAQTVYGEDINLNGLLDVNEDDADATLPFDDDGDGQLNRGLLPYVTALAREPDVDTEGNARVDINGDANALAQSLNAAGLGAGTANFIVQARRAKVTFTDPSQLLGMSIEVQTQAAASGRRRRGRRGRGGTATRTQRISSGVTAENLPTVMDKLTCSAAAGSAQPAQAGVASGGDASADGEIPTGEAAEGQIPTGAASDGQIPTGADADGQPSAAAGGSGRGIALQGQGFRLGRVNLNSAPVRVLSALPGLDEKTAQDIVDVRGELDPETKSTTAWLYTRNVVSADLFKTVAPFLTARSYQFRVRSFGYSLDGRRFCVLEATVDTISGKPRIVYLRDLTRLGVPFAPEGIER